MDALHHQRAQQIIEIGCGGPLCEHEIDRAGKQPDARGGGETIHDTLAFAMHKCAQAGLIMLACRQLLGDPFRKSVDRPGLFPSAQCGDDLGMSNHSPQAQTGQGVELGEGVEHQHILAALRLRHERVLFGMGQERHEGLINPQPLVGIGIGQGEQTAGAEKGSRGVVGVSQ